MKLIPSFEAIYHSSPQTKGLPFSEAVQVGPFLYLSGQIGVDSNMMIIPGGIAAETCQTMQNIKTLLERYGCTLDDVFKVVIMLADIGEWEEMNKVYVPFFPKHLPTRSAFGCNGLAKGARVEIECVALIH